MKHPEKYAISVNNQHFLNEYTVDSKYKGLKTRELIIKLLEDERLIFSTYYEIASYVNAIKGTKHDYTAISKIMSNCNNQWTKTNNRYILDSNYFSTYRMYDSPFITIFEANEELLKQISEHLLSEYGEYIIDMQYGICGNLIVYSTMYALSTQYDMTFKRCNKETVKNFV